MSYVEALRQTALVLFLLTVIFVVVAVIANAFGAGRLTQLTANILTIAIFLATVVFTFMAIWSNVG
jgi:uncharacterized membrane protein YtjA (UPF0391 family)